MAGTGRSVKLIPTEEKLLFELSVHAGRALTNDQLMRQVLAQRQPGDPQVVRAYVGRLSGRPRDHAYSPDLHFQRVPGGLSHGQGRDAGTGGAVTFGALNGRRLPNRTPPLPCGGI